jgi:hypothetical protein
VAEFLSLVLPLFFLAASTIGVVWFQFIKSNLRIVAAEAAFLATQADTTVSEVETFSIGQIEQRLGLPLSKFELTKSPGQAGVELGIEQLELVGIGGIFSPVILVRSHGAAEL